MAAHGTFHSLFYLTYAIHATIGIVGANNDIDTERYRAGKEKYEMLKKESTMPKYSSCWTRALSSLDNGCKHLTDDVQHRLALKFTNCFLMKTGRETYDCDDTVDIAMCTGDMKPEAYNTYTEFFTHTQNICFFLQSQAWQAETETTIERLSDNSAMVAQQIEDSSQLQNEVIQKQNESIKNQQLLMERGKELKSTLEESSMDVQHMVQEFKDSTSEQRLLIIEVFDRLNSLQSIVMGEFTGFYSVVFYTLAVLVCYLLTSTPRTSSARFWLFVIMTVNIIVERLLVSCGSTPQTDPETGTAIDESTTVYRRLWWCRKVFSTVAVATWLRFAYVFRDFNKINNELLVEIRKQNSDLKHLLQGSSTNKALDSSLLNKALDYTDTSMMNQSNTTDLVTYKPSNSSTPHNCPSKDSSTTGYESDASSNSSATSLDSVMTDRTFTLTLAGHSSGSDDDDADSFCTTASRDTTHTSVGGLEEELRYLRDATPLREMWGPSAMGTPTYGSPCKGSGDNVPTPPTGSGRRGRPKGSKNKPAPQPLQIPTLPPGAMSQRYNLRSHRGVLPTVSNPVVHSESAQDFGHMVRQMAKISQRNKTKAEITLSRNKKPNTKFFSSDED